MHSSRTVNQAEYAIRIPVAAPQEYVNTYSTRRPVSRQPRAPVVPAITVPIFPFFTTGMVARVAGKLEALKINIYNH